MPTHNFERPRGRLVEMTVASTGLAGNMLDDPTDRTVTVYLPQGYDESDSTYPLFVDLAGFFGSGLKRIGWQPFGESVPQRIDRLVAQGSMGPVVVAFPDAFTRLGGNQYIDSPVFGLWEQFVRDDMIPQLEANFRVRAGGRHRAIYGRSSGGYGAMIQGMRHAADWGAIACHAGDMFFEWLYLRDFPRLLDTLAPFGGSIERFIEHLERSSKHKRAEDDALMLLAMAASYDPEVTAPFGIRLPVNVDTCELIPERWATWLKHDPVRMIERGDCQQQLRQLGLLYLDCGNRDEYFMHYGARAFVERLRRFDIPHHYEEFDGGHGGTDYRLDISLPLLYRAVSQ